MGENTLPSASGNYVFVLRENCNLPDIGIQITYSTFNGYNVIYTGIASESLKNRDLKQHFQENAGRSTLRKSLGRLFGYSLVPRDRNHPENNKTKFCDSDEIKLSDWMKANLLIFYYANNDYENIESELIQKLNPPLNLKGNNNTVNSNFRAKLSDLRSGKTKLS